MRNFWILPSTELQKVVETLQSIGFTRINAVYEWKENTQEGGIGYDLPTREFYTFDPPEKLVEGITINTLKNTEEFLAQIVGEILEYSI